MWLQIKEFIRSKRNKPFSFIINGIGMSLAFAAVIILFSYVRSELEHDSHVLNREHIVRAHNNNWGIMPGAYAAWMKDVLPEIKRSCRLYGSQQSVVVPRQEEVEAMYGKEMVLLADSTYPSMFGLKLVEGDFTTALATFEQCIVSESMAHKLFGSSDPIGKYIVLRGRIRSSVVAVFEDIRGKGLQSPEIIVGADFMDEYWGKGNADSWVASSWEIYFELEPGCDRDNLTRKYRQLYAEKLKSFGWDEKDVESTVPYAKFVDYADIYFTPEVDLSNHGNRTELNVLLLIVIAILVVSIINYVNMATARLADKSRIIGMKRTLGAGRNALIVSIVLDSVITCFLSLFVAWLLATTVSPHLYRWLGYANTLQFDAFSILMLGVVIPLGCGLLSGIFPAIYLTRMNRIDSMNSQGNESVTLRRFKSGLTVMQFVVSLGLIIATLFIGKQVNYMKHIDPGYDKSNVVVVSGHGESGLYEKIESFRTLLLQNPHILKVAAASEGIYNITTQGGNAIPIPGTNERTGGFVTWIDEQFMDLMGLQIVEGEGFRSEPLTSTSQVIINENLAKVMVEASPEHSWVTDGVKGVVKNFNFKSLHQSIGSMFFMRLNTDKKDADAYIRITPENREQTLAYIEKCYRQLYPSSLYQYSFMEDDYARLYGSEELFLRRVLTFSGMSIVIACLGLLAFVVFFIEQKTKSIGVRKIMGATEMQVMKLLNRDFVIRLFVAFIITCPCIYYLMNRWLSDFAYRVELSWWVFLLAFVLLLLIALLTVSLLTWKAATANPVDALKSE